MTRRGLVAAAPAAVLLAGCGAGSGEAVPEPTTRRITAIQGDVELLQAAVRRERTEVALYEALEGRLDGAARFAEVEREHERRLAEALAGFEASAPAGRATAPRVRDPLDHAIDAEADAVAFWVDAVPKLYDPALRSLAAGILTAEAEQLAALRAALGLDPAPDAFVYGWTRHGAR